MPTRIPRRSSVVMVNSQPNSDLDEVILQVFEVEDLFTYPVLTQKDARAFVREIHGKGVSYDKICEEVGEHEMLFSSWRKSLGRPGIGAKVIQRINRPLNDLLEEEVDDGGVNGGCRRAEPREAEDQHNGGGCAQNVLVKNAINEQSKQEKGDRNRASNREINGQNVYEKGDDEPKENSHANEKNAMTVNAERNKVSDKNVDGKDNVDCDVCENVTKYEVVPVVTTDEHDENDSRNHDRTTSELLTEPVVANEIGPYLEEMTVQILRDAKQELGLTSENNNQTEIVNDVNNTEYTTEEQRNTEKVEVVADEEESCNIVETEENKPEDSQLKELEKETIAMTTEKPELKEVTKELENEEVKKEPLRKVVSEPIKATHHDTSTREPPKEFNRMLSKDYFKVKGNASVSDIINAINKSNKPMGGKIRSGSSSRNSSPMSISPPRNESPTMEKQTVTRIASPTSTPPAERTKSPSPPLMSTYSENNGEPAKVTNDGAQRVNDICGGLGVNDKDGETKPTKGAERNGPQIASPQSEKDQRLVSDVNENYNSDLDADNVDQSPVLATLVRKISGMRSGNKDTHGYLYMFCDNEEDTAEGRVKVSISRCPMKRLQQARLFNPDIRLVVAVPVSHRITAIKNVRERLEPYTLDTIDWYTGRLDTIKGVVEQIGSEHPPRTLPKEYLMDESEC